MLCFLHVPKTAGRALGAYFQNAVGPEFAVGSLREEPLRTLRDDVITRLRILSAHMAYDDLTRLRRLGTPPVRLATLVRDPSERFISHFFFMKRCPIHDWYGYCRDLSLDQALADPTLVAEIDNYQCRYLARALAPSAPLDAHIEARIWPELETVGDVAHVAASALLMLYRSGIPPAAPLSSFDVPVGAMERDDLSAGARRYIDEQLNGLDWPIYLAGRDRFLRDFAAMARDLGMAGLDPRQATARDLEACRQAALTRLAA